MNKRNTKPERVALAGLGVAVLHQRERACVTIIGSGIYAALKVAYRWCQCSREDKSTENRLKWIWSGGYVEEQIRVKGFFRI